MAIVGVAQVKVTPDLHTFRSELEKGLKEMRPEVVVKVRADTDTADKEIEAWRAKQSNRKTIKQKVDIDTSAFDKIGQAGSSFAGIATKIQLATIAGTALIGTMQALGPIIAGLAGGVALIPAALFPAVGIIAAMKLGADGAKKAFESLKPTLDTLKKQVGDSLAGGLASGISDLKKQLPQVHVGLQSIAMAMGQVLGNITSTLQKAGSFTQLNSIFIVTSMVIKNLGKAFGPIIAGLINIAEIGVPMFNVWTKGAGDAAKRFQEWTASAEGGAKISSMITGFVSAMRQLWAILQQVGGIITNIFSGISAGAGSLGGSVLPVLTKINQVLGSTVGQQALAALGSAISALGSAFAAQLGPALTALLPYLTQVFNFIAAHADTLAPIIAGAGAAALVFGKLAPAIGLVTKAFALLGKSPIVGIAVIIAGIVAAIIGYLQKTGQLQPLIEKLMSVLQPLMSAVLPVLQSLFQALVPPLMQLVQVIGGALMTVIQALMPPLMQLIQAIIPPLMSVFQALMPVIVQVAQFIGQLVTALSPILGLMGQLVGAILPPLISLFTSVLKPVLDLAAAFLGPIISAIGSVIGWITNLWGQINQAGGILAVLKNVFSVAWNFIKGVWSAVSGFFVGIWNGIVNTAKSVISGIGDVFKSVWEFIKSIWNGVSGFFKGIWDGIVSGLKSVLNGAIKVINGIISGINLLPGVNIPKIPMLARGGTALGDQPYIVGEKGPELFIPNKTGRVVDNRNTVRALNGAASSTGGGSGITVDDLVAAFSRMRFQIDPSGQARITSTGAGVNKNR